MTLNIPAKDLQVGDLVCREPQSDMLIMETNPPAPRPWETVESVVIEAGTVTAQFTPSGVTDRWDNAFPLTHTYAADEVVLISRR